ncbi:uncharacterized protein LOC125673397 isoform X3 [Ostrea edulis]|uniref:uncharacterized protein LOC125673397 isoform X3 n=1 Tax=Ostrea edulis TaxID=37623 RepID=UPI0020959C19|nr:uncharacterized protein LOC125673397 isoform X3 [Ostrea edulis]
MDIIYFVVSTICLSSALSEHQTSKCHGNNYMNSMCSDSGVIAIRHLQLTSISQNTATPWTRMECGNRTFSNYVLVSFDCIKVSKGEFEIECNPRLSTTSSTPTTTVHSTISGGQGNRVTNKRRTTLSPGVKTKPPGTKKPGPDIHNSGPSARVRERAVQNTVLYAVFAVSIIAAILIIVAGVFIRRVRRSGKRQRLYKRVQEKLRSSDSTTFSLQTLPRENSTNIYPSSTDQLY